MTNRKFDSTLWLTTVAPMIGLNIDEKHLPGVILNLDIAAEMMNSLDALIIEDDVSMSNSFTHLKPTDD
tara:strand:- start:136 stop:342 length:207 start_codon:yes stop_codon:yes gene_type:complete